MTKVIIRGLNCPVARALEIIGEKWTLLILRDLFLDGAKKYQELLLSLEGISPNILSTRLKKLVEYGIIQKEIYVEHPPRYIYSLTNKGESLKPILTDIKSWGQQNTIS